jgi:hypothetical protein
VVSAGTLICLPRVKSWVSAPPPAPARAPMPASGSGNLAIEDLRTRRIRWRFRGWRAPSQIASVKPARPAVSPQPQTFHPSSSRCIGRSKQRNPRCNLEQALGAFRVCDPDRARPDELTEIPISWDLCFNRRKARCPICRVAFNADGRSSLFPAGSSVARECAAIRLHSVHRLDHHPPNRRLSRRP